MAPKTWKTSSPAAEAVKANNGQGVAGAGIGEQIGEAGPIHAFAGLNIGEHLHRASLCAAGPVLRP